MSTLVRPLTLILGVVLLAVGALGFVMPSPLLGLFEVDMVHNIVHLLSGAVALVAGMMGTVASRWYLQVFGAVYLVVAIVGFAMAGNILGLFHANMEDNLLHTAIGVVCLLVGFLGSAKKSMAAAGNPPPSYPTI